MPASTISPFGERGFIAKIENFSSDVDSGLFANAVADALRGETGVEDAVAGVNSVIIRFDPSILDGDKAHAMLADVIAKTPQDRKNQSANVIEIAICYGGEHGPDLEALCKTLHLSPEELIRLHAEKPYRLIILGFSPGFAYLGELDEKIRGVPRLKTPRARLAAGSVGMVGRFTGIYSLPSPGGWPIIGRTPRCLFNPKAKDPFIFRAGDEVRFKPISAEEFSSLHEVER